MYGLGRLAFILLAIGIAGVALWQVASRWRPSIEDYPVQGVDVSEAQGAIEWNAVAAAGADFAYAVATRGAGQRDRTFEANWHGIEAAGLRRGAIHVWSFCHPATDQADAFNTVVPRDAAALPAAIDVAVDPACPLPSSPEAVARELAQAATMIETHMGKPVLFRVTRAIDRELGLSARLQRPIWAAGNFIAPNYAARPWRMWRATDLLRLDGVEGAVNWNVVAR